MVKGGEGFAETVNYKWRLAKIFSFVFGWSLKACKSLQITLDKTYLVNK